MQCEIKWCKEGTLDATPDNNDAIGLCGVYHHQCQLYIPGGCKLFQRDLKCMCPLVDVRPNAYSICAEHAKRLAKLPNWWFLDTRDNAL